MTKRTRPEPRRRDGDLAGEIRGDAIPKSWALPIGLAVAALAWFAFAPALGNGFVDVDDTENFLQNHAYRGLGWPQVVDAFTRPRVTVYQPLNSLLWSAVYLGWGLDPAGYHATGLALHALNAALLFALVLALLARRDPALLRERPREVAVGAGLAVAWFAAHPLRAETVAWATVQLYLTGACFALLATLAYLGAYPAEGAPRRRWRLGLAYALAIGGMLCMPGTVVLPALFLILDAAILGRIDLVAGSAADRARRAGRLVVEKLPVLAPALAVMAAAYWAKRSGKALPNLERDGPWGRLAQAGYGVWLYLGKTIAPIGVSAFYPRPEGGDFRSPVFAAAVLGVVLATVAVVALRRRVRWLPAAWAAYLLILAPHLGLIPVGKTIAADRYTYLASMVWVFPLAAGLARLGRRAPAGRARVAAAAVGLALVLGLAGLAREQTRTWHDSEALWSHAVACAPGSSQTHALKATALGEAGRHDEAVPEYDAALALWDQDAETLVKRGASLAALGRLDEATASDRAALALRPDLHLAYLNLGVVEALRGRNAEAIAFYQEALNLAPALTPAYVKLGIARLQLGQAPEAEVSFLKAIDLAPWDVEAHTNLGAALALQKDLAGAIAEYQEALREDPNHVPALLNLGMAQAQSGHMDLAIPPLTTAAALAPGNADAHHTLGVILAGQGRLHEAAAEFDQALRARPDHEQAKLLLGMVRQQLGAGVTLRR